MQSISVFIDITKVADFLELKGYFTRFIHF